MARHNFAAPRGTRVEFTIDSRAIANNRLGDPTTRRVAVYLPEGYEGSSEEYPLFVDLVGFSGSGLAHFNWRPFGDNIPQRIDRLIDEGAMGPVVTVFPDCFTTLGGNQYINSSTMGNWEDFLIEEMLPAVEARFRVRKGRHHRALFGKSSGGYGAISHGLRRADTWAAVACHSGDMGFPACYGRDFPALLDVLAGHDRSIDALLTYYESLPKIGRDEFHMLELLAMAASYDPDPGPGRGIRLPVDLYTGEMIPERWDNWLAHDPVEMARRPECIENARSLKGLYIECGDHDQYALVYGARALSARLAEAGVEHRYEEFDDDHTAVDYRQDVSFPFLYEALTA
jgi:enterochelin esterase-like enzyme